MNYQYCTIEDLFEFFKTKTSQAITQQLTYYSKKGDTATVVKIKKARILLNQWKLAEKMEGL